MFGDVAIADLSSSALLGLAVLLVMTGLLVPRRTLKDKAEETERWRQAFEAERTARGISDAQTNELLEVARTTHALLIAMSATSERLRTGESNAPAET